MIEFKLKMDAKKFLTSFHELKHEDSRFSRGALTLNRGCEIHGVEATGTELFVGPFFSFAKPMPRMVLAPKIRAPVSERNVQQRDSLQRWPVRQIQRRTVAL